MTQFSLLKWLHVLSAIVVEGANATCGVWLVRASRKPEVLPFRLRTVKILDDRMANPAYALPLATGLLMVFVAPFPFTTPWILTALIPCGVVFLIAIFGYSPALRQQIHLIESAGPQSEAFLSSSRRAAIVLRHTIQRLNQRNPHRVAVCLCARRIP